jgi:glutamate-1-semialdehyde 2,1-aminomutase
MAGGISTLSELKKSGFYEDLNKSVIYLADGFKNISKKYNINVVVNQFGSMMGIFFSNSNVNNFKDVANSRIDIYNSMHRFFLDNNIYLPPSGYEAFFISNTHKKTHFDEVLDKFEEFCIRLNKKSK